MTKKLIRRGTFQTFRTPQTHLNNRGVMMNKEEVLLIPGQISSEPEEEDNSILLPRDVDETPSKDIDSALDILLPTEVTQAIKEDKK